MERWERWGFTVMDCPGHDVVEVDLVAQTEAQIRGVEFGSVERWIVEELRRGPEILISDVTASTLAGLRLRPDGATVLPMQRIVMRIRNTMPESRSVRAVLLVDRRRT